MVQNTGRKRWLGAGVTVGFLGVLAVVAIWMSLDRSTNPDHQMRTERPGVGEYFVNLWTDPNPLTTGDAELSAQVSSIIGTPLELNSLEFDIVPPDGEERTTLDTELTFDGPNDGDLYVAQANFDQAGTWRVIVRYSFGGPEVESAFELDVTA